MPTSETQKITVPMLQVMKNTHKKIACLTAYDYLFAVILDQCDLDVILVGDSGAMVFAGHDTTLPITVDEMIYHVRAVRRGVKRALLVADMPFLSYQASPETAIQNAGRFLKESGAEAVKLEGGSHVVETVRRLVEIGIPVMGHLGLTPQSVNAFGGYVMQAKTEAAAKRLLQEAQELQEAGIFAIVLEKIPRAVAKKVTESLTIPTIGIAAGPDCDGQILVTHDMLGLYEKFRLKFARRYAEIGQEIRTACSQYAEDVRSGNFPNDAESYE